MIRIIFPTMVFGLFFALPETSHALDPIVHCGFNGTICTACDFFTLSANIMRWLVALVTLVVTLVMVTGGIRIITSQGNPTQLGKAKSMMFNALIGFIILLAAWLIIDTAMKLSKFGTGSELGPWNAVATDACKVAQGTYVPTPSGGTGSPTTPTTPTPGSGANCPAADPSIMVNFPTSVTENGKTIQATSDTVDRFMKMYAAGQKDGVTFKVTSGYRSEAKQVELWNQYGCNTGTCRSPVAKPCSLGGGGSNHNSGVALDLSNGCAKTDDSCRSPARVWLEKNGPTYQFKSAVENDVIHYSPTGR